jgi:hypothetical protein
MAVTRRWHPPRVIECVSDLESFKSRIKALELDVGIRGCEAPIGLVADVKSLFFNSGNFAAAARLKDINFANLANGLSSRPSEARAGIAKKIGASIYYDPG